MTDFANTPPSEISTTPKEPAYRELAKKAVDPGLNNSSKPYAAEPQSQTGPPPGCQRVRASMSDACKRYSKSRTTINEWISIGRLPKPHYLWGRAYWWLDELEAHDEAHTETYEEHVAQLKESAACPVNK